MEFEVKPMCLVCMDTKSAMKEFNLSRHYNTTHKGEYNKNTSADRTASTLYQLAGEVVRTDVREI